MKRAEIVVSIGTALLAFGGALAGVIISPQLDQWNWAKRFEVEQKRTLLEKRIAVLERTAAIVSKRPLKYALNGSIQTEHQVAKIIVDCTPRNGKEMKNPRCYNVPKTITMDRTESIGREISALDTELITVTTLAKTYFGPETKKLLQSRPVEWWWGADDAAVDLLMTTMGRELTVFADTPKSILMPSLSEDETPLKSKSQH